MRAGCCLRRAHYIRRRSQGDNESGKALAPVEDTFAAIIESADSGITTSIQPCLLSSRWAAYNDRLPPDLTLVSPQTLAAHELAPSAFGGYDHRLSSGPRPGPKRPSMRGWWVCCVCRQTNNPTINPLHCSACGRHTKCSNCYVYRQ